MTKHQPTTLDYMHQRELNPDLDLSNLNLMSDRLSKEIIPEQVYKPKEEKKTGKRRKKPGRASSLKNGFAPPGQSGHVIMNHQPERERKTVRRNPRLPPKPKSI